MKMEKKFQLLAMMFVAALAFSACSDDDDNKGVVVPEAVSKALTAKFPTATNVEWEQKKSYFVADCRVDGKDKDVWFDAQAAWQLTETDIFWNDLPAAVQTAFEAGEYAAWKREDIDMLEYPVQPVRYVIEVENGAMEYQLFYAGNGNFLNKRDVSGDKDDTHLPTDKWGTADDLNF